MKEAQIQAQTDALAERRELMRGYFTLNRDRQTALLDLLLGQAREEVRDAFGCFLSAYLEAEGGEAAN